MLVVVLQEWLCSCADIVPAVTPPNNGDAAAAAAASVDSTPANNDADRLTPSAMVAVHRAVLGLHTWALAIDGGQPAATTHRRYQQPQLKQQQQQQHTNTKTTDEYHHTAKKTTHFEQQHINMNNNNVTMTMKSRSATNPHVLDEDDDDIEGFEETDAERVDNYNPQRPTSLDVVADAGQHQQNRSVRRRIAAYENNNHLIDQQRDYGNDDDAAAVEAAAAAAVAASMALKMRKRRHSAPVSKRSYGSNGQLLLNGQLGGIVEECEYDSDAGKFTCAMASKTKEKETAVSVVCTADAIEATSTVNGNALPLSANVDSTSDYIVLEPIVPATAEERKRSTLMCLGGFLLTVLLLYLFPISD